MFFNNRYIAIILLSVSGFAANWFKLELFFNVDFIFGSVFVLLVSTYYGLLPGIVSGIVAGSCTLLLWHHPWALIIVIAESVIVGVIVKRRKFSLLAADTFFWLLCGAPLVWLFYRHVMGIPEQSCLLILLKQSLNGICNAIFAQLVLFALQAHQSEHSRYPRFQQLVFTVMVFLTMLVGMLTLVTNLRSVMKRQLQELADDANHTSLIAASSINSWLQQQQQSVEALAQLVGEPGGKTPGELQHLVETVNASVPAFQWMGILDHTARTIAYDPLIDDNGRSNVGIDYSDRPYIPVLRETGKPYISDIISGKIGNRSARAIILVPLVVNNRYRGFCVGVTRLELVHELLETLADQHDMQVTLVDRKGQVVASTRNDLAAMNLLTFSGGERRNINPHLFQWVPPIPAKSSIMERWRKSRFVAERQLSDQLPWKVVVEISPKELLNVLTRESINDIALLLLIFMASSLLAGLMGRMFLKPLDKLRSITHELPGLIPAVIPKSSWPNSRMFELDSLSTNFRAMATMLNDKFVQQETTYKQLVQETEKRRNLEQQIVNLREQVEHDERGRISRELHDSLGQSLQAVKLNLQIVQSRCVNRCSGELIDTAIFDIGAASEELRDIVTMLRPPVLAEQNLIEALSWMAERLSKRSGIEIRILDRNVPEVLPVNLKSGVFRICQEALSNAIRHGRATLIELQLICNDGALHMLLHDNGSGFNPQVFCAGSGIGIMKERASLLNGIFKLESREGKGTSIKLEVPLP